MSKMTHTTPSHVELTVRRPNGTVEVVRADKLGEFINDKVFASVVAQTKAAGRGDVLSYTNVTATHTETDAQYATRLAGEKRDAEIQADRRAARAYGCGERDETNERTSRAPSHKAD